MPAQVRVFAQRAGYPKAAIASLHLAREFHRRSQVAWSRRRVRLALAPTHPGRPTAIDPGRDLPDQVGHPGQMSPARCIFLPSLGQALARILPDRAQQLVPCSSGRVINVEQRFVGEPVSRSSMCWGAMSSPAATCSAEASVNPPANTASRRNTACSSVSSRSWLQSGSRAESGAVAASCVSRQQVRRRCRPGVQPAARGQDPHPGGG